jgi:hypothetical protein
MIVDTNSSSKECLVVRKVKCASSRSGRQTCPHEREVAGTLRSCSQSRNNNNHATTICRCSQGNRASVPDFPDIRIALCREKRVTKRATSPENRLRRRFGHVCRVRPGSSPTSQARETVFPCNRTAKVTRLELNRYSERLPNNSIAPYAPVVASAGRNVGRSARLLKPIDVRLALDHDRSKRPRQT